MISVQSEEKRIKPKMKFLCDYRSDITSLPTTIDPDPTAEGYNDLQFPYGVLAGSLALVTEDTSVWILSNAGTWIEL